MPKLQRALPWLVACAAAALIIDGACSIYDASLLVPQDAGDAATVPDSGADADTCGHAQWPGRPAQDDDGGVDAGDLVFAITNILFDPDAGGGALVGYDLDHTCTCPGPGSCIAPSGQTPVCDDEAGRDDSAGLLLSSLTSVVTFLDPQKLNGHLQAGDFGFIVRISGYNGTPNDTQVQAAVFASNGTVRDDAGAPTPPKYDGTDQWTIDPESLFGGIAPPYIAVPNSVDTSAYVSSGVMVASLPSVDVALAAGGGTASLGIHLSSVVVTGTLTPDGSGGYRVTNGLLAGRWRTDKFLTALAPIRGPINNDYLCGDSGTYQTFKTLICKARDITSTPLDDNTGAPCDSVSVAIGYQATPAQFGGVLSGTLVQPCGPTWNDDCP